MTAKSLIGLSLKFVVLALLYLILFTISGMIVPMDLPPLAESTLPAVYRGLVLSSVVNTLVVMLLISASQWRGWKLIVGLWFAYYGVSVFMAQMETWYFAPALNIDRSIAFAIILQNLIMTLIFIPLAVIIMGKAIGTEAEPHNQRLIMPVSQWAWKLPLIAAAYLILYFGFGQLVAWQNPALREMYGGGANQEVFANIRLIPFQIFRSMLWLMFCLPVIRFVNLRAWGAAILLGLLLALPMNIGHAIPNPIMPDPSVRLSHFIETASSNFLFGLFIYWLMHRAHTSLADFFGGRPEPVSRPTTRIAGG